LEQFDDSVSRLERDETDGDENIREEHSHEEDEDCGVMMAVCLTVGNWNCRLMSELLDYQ
jgi:hypothetical protein